MSIESMMPSNHLIHCHHLLLLPSIFPSIKVFPVNWLFELGGQSIGASALALVFPMIIQDWFLKDWLVGCPCSPRESQESSPTPQSKSINSLAPIFFMVQQWHPYMTTGKTIPLTIGNFVSKVISLLFNTLSRFVIAFLLRSKQSPSTVILEPRKIMSVTVSIVSPSICHEVMGPDATILGF